MGKGGRYIFRKEKKVRWKKMVKNKSIKRGNNFRFQKYHAIYPLDISNISNEV
jgi:hypothetical protein